MKHKEVVCLINKVVICDEARFDYEEIVAKRIMPATMMKREIEYSFLHTAPDGSYFYKKYFDEEIGKMLILFFRRGYRYARMQLWKMVGICEEEDFSEELDLRGSIKNWLDTHFAV